MPVTKALWDKCSLTVSLGVSSPLSWDNWEAGQAPSSEDIVLLAPPLSATAGGERLIVNHRWFQWRLKKARDNSILPPSKGRAW